MSHRSVAHDCHNGAHAYCTGLVHSWESPSLSRNCACSCHRGESPVVSRYTLLAAPMMLGR